MVDEPARIAPSTGCLEVVTPNGYRVVIDGATDEAALAREPLASGRAAEREYRRMPRVA
jgi:hypothetical protein